MKVFLVAVYYFLQVVTYLIFGRAMLSWFIRDPKNPIMNLLITITEPILSPVRRLLFKLKIGGNMVDFSPLAALILVQILMGLVYAAI
ncbi:YggT family protein [Fusibacter bizertensis]